MKANREARLWPEREIIVELNGESLSASYPNGDLLKVNLGDLQEVKIITNDSGPWGADVWYLFSSTESRCGFPQGATGEKEATEYQHTFKESKKTIEVKGTQTYTTRDTMIFFEKKPYREIDTTYKQSETYVPPSYDNIDSFIKANIIYPRKAKKKGHDGTVVVKLRINEEGKIILSEIAESQGEYLDEEALRLVKYMKDWNPATNNGKAIPDWVTFPVDFVLPK